MILPYLTEQSKSFYALTLADILMHAHDVIGWGETSNIRRVLQVSTYIRDKV
jgi:hypothetical protein